MKVRDRIKSLRRVRAGDLRPNPKNWRRHPAVQQKAMRAALAEIGWADACLARETPEGLELVDGHLRAELDPDQKVPVLILDLDEAEAAKVLATLDPLAGLAETDVDVLRGLVDDLDFDQPDLEAVVAGLLGQNVGVDVIEDEPPEPPDDPVTRPGDVWALGEHRLLCGDSRDEDDIAQLWQDVGACDAVVTDPPYGVEYVGKTAQALTIENDGEAGLAELLTGAFGLAFRYSRAGAVWYVAAPAGPQFHEFATVLRDLGVWRQTLVWAKDTMVLGRSDYHYQHEVMFYGWKPGAAHREPPDRKQTTVWECPRPTASREHPTMKPVALFARAISNSTAKGDVVYDPFLGSGTTLIAAEQLGRRCLGVEIGPAYCDVIVQRWEALTERKADRERKPRPGRGERANAG